MPLLHWRNWRYFNRMPLLHWRNWCYFNRMPLLHWRNWRYFNRMPLRSKEADGALLSLQHHSPRLACPVVFRLAHMTHYTVRAMAT